jgi:hypothetical protein
MCCTKAICADGGDILDEEYSISDGDSCIDSDQTAGFIDLDEY